MRTLKRSLCLALALVFVLGLCTIGVGAADFSDSAKINYKDAVAVMTGLGIIQGDDNDGDGKMDFRPGDPVTREEAAKLVAYMVLGAKNAEKLPAGNGGFSDVDAKGWSAKYINFCASKGYIKGLGDGTFNPKGNIKGTELATILLRVVGYGVMGEYEGKGWDINAVSDALAKGILKDSEAEDFAAPATREETSLYFFNTMCDVQLVGYDVDKNYYDQKTTLVPTGATIGGTPIYNEVPVTYGNDVYNLQVYRTDNTDQYQVIENQATAVTKYTVVQDRLGTQYNFAIETGLDLIGHQVNVYFKGEEKKDNGTVYYEAYLLDDVSTVLNKGTYYGDTYNALVAANKTNKSLNMTTIPTWTNYDWSAPGTYAGVTDYDTNATHTMVSDLQNQFSSNDQSAYYISGDWILDYEGVPLVILSTSSRMGKVTAVASDNVTVNMFSRSYTTTPATDTYTSTNYDLDVTTVYDGIAKNDYVVVQPVGDLFEIKPTSTQTVTVTQRTDYTFFGGSFADSIYFNNMWISPGNGYGISVPNTTANTNVRVGDTVKFYVQRDYGIPGYFTYFALEILESGTADGIVFANTTYTVTADDKYGSAVTTTYLQAVNEEGAEVVYPMTTAGAATYTGPGVYTVYLNSKGEVSSLQPVANSTATKASGKSSYVQGTTGIYYVNGDTNIYYVSGTLGNMKVNASKSLATSPATYTMFINPAASGSGFAAKTIWITAATVPTTYADSYLFLNGGTDFSTWGGSGTYTTSSGKIAVNGSEADSYKFYIDGEEITANVTSDDSSLFLFGGVKDGFYKYSVNEYGQYVLTAVTNAKFETLAKGTAATVADGKLYTTSVDGKAISAKVVDISGDAIGTNGETDANVNSLERLEELLGEGYTIDVAYIYTSTSTFVPVGTLYVTNVA